MILFTCDLDNTLIHSYKKASDTDICVECADDGKKLSYMTPDAYSGLDEIDKLENLCIVPLTTRSIEQYQRIHLFKDRYPKYALTSNGGNLLIDNVISEEWHSESVELIKECIPELKKAIEILKADDKIQFEPRFVDELFVYTKSDEPEKTAENMREKLDLEVVSVFTNNLKVYAMPKILSKGTAVKRFRKKFGFEFTISAGDSDFDLPMLEYTDISFYPSKEFAETSCTEKKKIIKSDGVNYAEFICKEVSNAARFAY